MPNQLRQINTKDTTSFPYVFDANVDVPMQWRSGILRADVFRPHDCETSGARYPALMTIGPYNKDVHYELFRKPSFDQVEPEHKSAHSTWETPDPSFWTKKGYVVIRVDEAGIGQSPGKLDALSSGTAADFRDAIEWAAEQPWCTGKIGLTGISYYAMTQWMAAALKPKGLACIIPWEGAADRYRDWARHGGIFANDFTRWWFDVQISQNRYGFPRKAARGWPETIEGNLDSSELDANMVDLNAEIVKSRYRDDDYWTTHGKDFDLSAVEVPLLSAANLGGTSLHLRGNVMGYMHAGSKQKWLRFIVGRHDLPYYYREEVAVQLFFLDAFLKDDDRDGWKTGGVAPVSLILREGNVGFNKPAAEKTFKRRDEPEWPLRGTQYHRYFLTSSRELLPSMPRNEEGTVEWKALSSESEDRISFTTPPFEHGAEFTGHPTVHLNVSVAADSDGTVPSDLDLFVKICHLDPTGEEVFYTGSGGDPVSVTNGWLRVSLRKTDPSHPHHREWLPYKAYTSKDVQPVKAGEVYPVDVEIWPTNVVVSPGGRLILEVCGADTPASAGTLLPLFKHCHPEDRSEKTLKGMNRLHFGVGEGNYLTMPFIAQERSL